MGAAQRVVQAAPGYSEGDSVAVLRQGGGGGGDGRLSRGAAADQPLGGRDASPRAWAKLASASSAPPRMRLDALIVIGGGAGILNKVTAAWIGTSATAIVVLEGLDGSVRHLAGRALDGLPPLGSVVDNAGGRFDMQQEGQLTDDCASSRESKPRGGHRSHRLGSRAMAATNSWVPLAQVGAPLPFSSWFTCQARLLDIELLILELLVINWTNLPKVIFRIRCLPVAGSPHAAFQDAFPPATHPAAARADERIFSFPCGAPYPQQLLHVAASGALTDPWVRVRVGDYGNLALIVTQLLAILVAVLLPRVYMRVRHWLLFSVNAAVLVGVAASVAWTPAALMPMGAASHLGHYWGSVMVLYLAWKSIYVLRVPSAYQLPFGLVLWLVTMAVMPAVRASLYPPPHGPAAGAQGDALPDAPLPTSAQLTHQPPHHKGLVSLLQQLLRGPALWIAVFSFLIMVVLPYAIARAWERAALRPRYRAYVAAVAEDAAASGTNRGGCRTQQEAGGSRAVEVLDGKDAARSDSPPAGGAPRSRAASNGNGGSLPGEGAGPSSATPFAAAAGAVAAGCNNGKSSHSAASPLDESTSVLSVPTTASFPSAPSIGDGGGTRRVGSSVAGAATAPADTAGRPISLLHSLHPRRPCLEIGLLTPAAAPHGTVQVDSGRQQLSNSKGGSGSGSGSGNVNTSIAVRSGYRSSPCSPLYGNLSPYKTKVLSVKVPMRHELGAGASRASSFPADAARVVDAANAAIARYNAAAVATAAAAAGSATGALAGAAGQVPDAAASCMEGKLPRAVPLSCVCVEGCVHLLMLVQVQAGVGAELNVDQLPLHGVRDDDGAGAAVVRHTTIGLGSSRGGGGGEGEDRVEVELGAAVEAAVLRMLGMLSQGTEDSNAGGGGGGSGGAAALAVVWPPAVAAVERSITGGDPGNVTRGRGCSSTRRARGESGCAHSGVEVVLACEASLLHGLEAVRCVVVGQGSGRGNEAAVGEAEQAQGQGKLYVDTVLPVASQAEEHGQQQGPVGAADAGAERVVCFRLPLPRSALLSPGVLMLHLLPPPSTGIPPDHPAPAPPSPHPPPPGPHPHAPLCFLPLLVLPADAAREMAQLHAYAVARELGWGQEEGQEGKGEEQLPDAAVGNVSYTTRASYLLGGTFDGDAAESAAAIAALHGNGMYSLSYDFAALLQLPYSAAGSTAADAGGPSPDPWVFCGVLRLLAGQGMGACLRMGLGAMQRAGVSLVDYGGGGMDGTGWNSEHVGSMVRDAFVAEPRGWLDPVMADTSTSSNCGAAVGAGTESAPAGIVRQHSWDSRCSPGGGDIRSVELEQHSAAHASCSGVQDPADLRTPRGVLRRLRLPSPFASTANTAGGSLTPTTWRHRPPFSPSPSLSPSSLPLPPPHGPWRWWLRSLLFGFSPAPLEKTYQDSFKAARCRACDCCALALNVAIATVTLVRMLRDGRQQGGPAAGMCGLPDVCPSGHVAARGGDYDPQLAAQVLWLSCAAASLLLASLTHLHARYRNAALVVRGLSTAAALALITWTAPVAPEPAAGRADGAAGPTQPWLLVPDGWVINCQRYGLHWFMFSLWDPAMLQLSLPLQAVVSAAYLVPVALLQLRVYPLAAVGQSQVHRQEWTVAGGCAGACFASSTPTAAAWRAAAVFAVGNTVCGLVISAVTDLAGRRAFVGKLRRRAVEQQKGLLA